MTQRTPEAIPEADQFRCIVRHPYDETTIHDPYLTWPARSMHDDDYDSAYPATNRTPALFQQTESIRVNTKTAKMSEQDRALVSAALDAAKDVEDPEDEAAFAAMLKRNKPLTDKQRAWAEGQAEGRFVEVAPSYVNLFSSGRVPLGNHVELPPVLRNLPLKPPGRR